MTDTQEQILLAIQQLEQKLQDKNVKYLQNDIITKDDNITRNILGYIDTHPILLNKIFHFDTSDSIKVTQYDYLNIYERICTDDNAKLSNDADMKKKNRKNCYLNKEFTISWPRQNNRNSKEDRSEDTPTISQQCNKCIYYKPSC